MPTFPTLPRGGCRLHSTGVTYGRSILAKFGPTVVIDFFSRHNQHSSTMDDYANASSTYHHLFQSCHTRAQDETDLSFCFFYCSCGVICGRAYRADSPENDIDRTFVVPDCFIFGFHFHSPGVAILSASICMGNCHFPSVGFFPFGFVARLSRCG